MKICRFFLLSILALYSAITLATETPAACGGRVGDIGYYNASRFSTDGDYAADISNGYGAALCETGWHKINDPGHVYCLSECTCPPPMVEYEEMPKDPSGVVLPHQIAPKHLCKMPPSNDSSSSSSSSSSSPSCPAGQVRDSNGTCSTCSAPQVLNIMTNQCEQKPDCIYPERYQSLDNTCKPNSDHCATNAGYNPLTEEKCSNPPTSPPPSCPAGWSLLPNNTCVKSTDTPPDSSGGGGGDGSNSGGVSASSSGAASSSPSSTPSASSTPSNNSNSSARPPYDSGDNIDQGQPQDSSRYIPQGTSNSACQNIASSVACKVIENCGLTFGADRCVGISSNVTCPNTYVVNGQKVCVLPAKTSGSGTSAGGAGSGSGSNGSAGKGECDPTAKTYDECMGRNKTPSAAETQKITDDLNREANKAIDDYNKAIKDDIDAFQREGIGFKNAPEQLRSSLNSLIPSAGSCENVVIEYHGWRKSLDCSLFEKFKLVFGWFLSIVTIYYIFQLAIKPVNK